MRLFKSRTQVPSQLFRNGFGIEFTDISPSTGDSKFGGYPDFPEGFNCEIDSNWSLIFQVNSKDLILEDNHFLKGKIIYLFMNKVQSGFTKQDFQILCLSNNNLKPYSNLNSNGTDKKLRFKIIKGINLPFSENEDEDDKLVKEQKSLLKKNYFTNKFLGASDGLQDDPRVDWARIAQFGIPEGLGINPLNLEDDQKEKYTSNFNAFENLFSLDIGLEEYGYFDFDMDGYIYIGIKRENLHALNFEDFEVTFHMD